MTLDDVLAAGMPAGSTVWHCPLCEWVHAQPPPDPFAPVPEANGASLGECIGNAATAILRQWYGEAETVIRDHLSSHPLIEWAREVQRQRTLEQAAARRLGEIVQHAPAILAALHLAAESAATPELATPHREALAATGWDERL